MSTAIPITLNHEQRGEAFTRALELEDELTELEALKARLLAGLEAKAEAMRQAHARLMRAAATGVPLETPEQGELPLTAVTAPVPDLGKGPCARCGHAADMHDAFSDEPTPNACAYRTESGECSCDTYVPPGEQPEEVEEEDDEPPPEPPKGKGRSRSQTPAPEKKGEKRADTTASARTAAENASAVEASTWEDALPAPRVPCCECSHSVADHKDGTGRCSGRVKGRSCRCKSFTAAGKAPPAEPPEACVSAHPCECDGCGEGFPQAQLQPVGNGFYCKGCKAELEEQDAAAGGESHRETPFPVPEEFPELDDPRTTPPTDGEAASEFHALDLTALHAVLGEPPAGVHRTYSVQVTGNSPRACEACGTRERPRAFINFDREDRRSNRGAYTGGGGFAMALCLEHCTVEGVKRAFTNRAHQYERERLAREQVEEDAGPTASSQTPPLDLFGRPWLAVDESTFPGWFVNVCPGFAGKGDSISAGRLDELFLRFDVKGPEGQELRRLCWFPAIGGVGRVVRGPDTEPAGATLADLPSRMYGALVSYLTKHWPLPEEMKAAARAGADASPPTAKRTRSRRKPAATAASDLSATPCGNLHEPTGVRCADPAGHTGGWHHGPPEPSGGARLRWKNTDYQYTGPEAGSGETQEASHPNAWRVELPERNQNSIIRLWLVNDATGERKPATWWGGTATLKRSHHLSGKLEGEALAALLELESWWTANAEAVVAPLAEACREGRVPGLKVYAPEQLSAGPHRYALSKGWQLETWEGEGEEAEPSVFFTRPQPGSDAWERFGPFVLAMQGQLTTADTDAAEWSADNDTLVTEAEGFCARGFILELPLAVMA